MKKLELSAYYYFQKKLLDHSDFDKELSIPKAKESLTRCKLPKEFVWQVIREMEQLGLLNIKTRKIKLKNTDKCQEIKTTNKREYIVPSFNKWI